ncbi:hypothetical protein POM88_016395 [Heracleum sosnowskyi]|uniref:Uncharacterized protein n=1 Tax=Heracleum sosnowskyi TaxID=360622 RepID=A0AAD8MXC6_9APIA|nr:hypothetical protein POM88_016395 [Heracleum sosnowskyi]
MQIFLHVPEGWDKLFVSIISVETGKTIAKSNKASIHIGTCQWMETLSESLWNPQDDSSNDLEEILLKLGSASYITTQKCNYGTVLQVLKLVLNTVEAEDNSISNEIEDLKRKYLKDSCQLESDLELLECTGLERAKASPNLDGKANENQMSSLCANQSSQFKVLAILFSFCPLFIHSN